MNTHILRKMDYRNAVCRVITSESEGGRELSPDSGFFSDRHPFFEILVNLKGTCDYPLAGKLFHITPGTAVLIPPWCLHSYGYRPCDSNLLHLWLHMHTSYFGSGIRIQHGTWTRCPELSFSFSAELFTIFLHRWEKWQRAGQPGQENLFFQNIMNLILDEMFVYEHEMQKKERDVVAETLALIRSSNGRGCTLDFLAEQARCSKFHLAHRVQKETGRTIGSFIEDARIGYVESARKQGLSQKEIAWNLGFSSGASFWNWYHRLRLSRGYAEPGAR